MIYMFITIVLAAVIIIGCVSYKIGISAPTKESKEIIFEVKEDSSYLSIAEQLKNEGLIRSINFYKVYIKIFKPENLQKGTYVLNQNMGVEKIIEKLEIGTYNSLTLTFQEGINMRKIVEIISSKTNNKQDDIYALLKDETYLDELINSYWFIGEEIKNEKIYYSLEGYLYPDTYQLDKECSTKDIFKVMLDQMEKKLEPYKDKIDNSSYTVHELLTMASITELEAVNEADRATVASVFYNRLKKGESLGSDVTTYYAAKVDVGTRDLKQSELDALNDYNTRNLNYKKLPISPICTVSLSAIDAAINPSVTDYLFFVADKNQKVYFTKTSNEHDAIIRKLKNEGLWYTWD